MRLKKKTRTKQGTQILAKTSMMYDDAIINQRKAIPGGGTEVR
jgi:hypothetical protein